MPYRSQERRVQSFKVSHVRGDALVLNMLHSCSESLRPGLRRPSYLCLLSRADQKWHCWGAAPMECPFCYSVVDQICLKTLDQTLRDLTRDGVKSRERYRNWNSPQVNLKWTPKLSPRMLTGFVSSPTGYYTAHNVFFSLLRALTSVHSQAQQRSYIFSRSESDELHTSKPSHSISITFIIAIHISKRALKT